MFAEFPFPGGPPATPDPVLDRAPQPKLGLSCHELVGERCRSTVRIALETGYRYFDTSRIAANEEDIGRAIWSTGIAREEVFISSKAWMNRLDPIGIERELADCLLRLGTDYLDLWSIHWPNPRIPLAYTMEALYALWDSGKVRHIGVCNFPTDLLSEALNHAPITCNQVEYHLFIDQAAVCGLARTRGVTIVAHTMMAGGRCFWDPGLWRIAQKHDVGVEQIALKWLLDQAGVSAMVDVTDADDVEAYWQAANVSLDDDDRREIAAFPKNCRVMNPWYAPRWDS